ncbi:hypothetical protein B0H34DRAFT_163995 [Crassisporium funariophilum]|nr:hypothetical protein B0H34DRAFT_163995 [Crassisporium funariophilum]
MKFSTAATTIALVSLAPGIFSLTVNTPSSMVECQPQLFTWTDGTPPYYLTIIPGGQASAAPIKSFDTQNGNSITYLCDIPAGTPVTIAVKDSTGAQAFSDIVNVQKGNDDSCLSNSSSASGVASSTNGNGSGGGNTGATTSNSAGSTTNSAASSATGTTTRAPASSGTSAAQGTRTTNNSNSNSATRAATTNTSGAESRFAMNGLGFTGIIGFLGALFL